MKYYAFMITVQVPVIFSPKLAVSALSETRKDCSQSIFYIHNQIVEIVQITHI